MLQPDARRRFSWKLPRALCLGVLVLSGCQWKGGPEATRTWTTSSDAVQGWVAEAVVMRVFPGGGLRQREGRSRLELRLELQDAMGDAVKTSGTYQIQLFSGFRLGENLGGQSLGQWQVPVLSLADHRERYDPITRTYQLLLNLEPGFSLSEPLLATVTFNSVHGQRLVSRAILDASGFRLVE